MTGDLSNLAGCVAPVRDPLLDLLVSGVYTQAAEASLNIALFGTGPGDYGRLRIGGSATLEGTIDIDLGGGFEPALGDTFDILQAASITKGNLAILAPDLPNGLWLDMELLATSPTQQTLRITAVPDPATLSLLALGTLAMVRRWRRR